MDLELYNAAISGSENFSEKIRGVGLNLQPFQEGNSILHIAAKSGKEHIAEEILNKLELQSLLYEENVKGNTPLHIAAMLGHFGMVKLLISRAREQDLEVHKELLKMVNLKKDTALHNAVRNGHYDIVELLIEKDLDLTSFTNSDGESPLFLAVDREFYGIAQHILDKVPECSYGGRNSMNVLHAAVIRSKKKDLLLCDVLFAYLLNTLVGDVLFTYLQKLWRCIDFLFRNLFDRASLKLPNSEYERARKLSMTRADFVGKVLNKRPSAITDADEFGWIPLHYAACLGNEDVVKLFMNFDTSLAYIKDKEGMSALHIASKEGYVDVTRTIIKICPDTSELLDKKGRTALHVAVEKGNRNVVKFFLQTPTFRNLIDEKDNEGNTPLLLSAIKRHYDLLILLVNDKRVDKVAMNVAGLTTLDIILSNKQLSVLEKDNIIGLVKRENFLPSLVQVVHTEMTLETNGNDGQIEENERRESAKAGVGMDAANIGEENVAKHVTVGVTQYKVSDVMNIANINLVIATIIATVTFQATFQVPGGYDESSGLAKLREKASFKSFMVADSMAFSFSAAAIFTNFYAAWVSKRSGFTYPINLVCFLTFGSLVCMAVAFVVGIRVVVTENSGINSSILWLTVCCFVFLSLYVNFRIDLLDNKFLCSQRIQRLISFL